MGLNKENEGKKTKGHYRTDRRGLMVIREISEIEAKLKVINEDEFEEEIEAENTIKMEENTNTIL
ncbi:hypothetical protein TSUD_307470 [Trifolium subterraneum]|nr:hypothetical protein TSUD_307470 [Trifolium subterraneum]